MREALQPSRGRNFDRDEARGSQRCGEQEIGERSHRACPSERESLTTSGDFGRVIDTLWPDFALNKKLKFESGFEATIPRSSLTPGCLTGELCL